MEDLLAAETCFVLYSTSIREKTTFERKEQKSSAHSTKLVILNNPWGKNEVDFYVPLWIFQGIQRTFTHNEIFQALQLFLKPS
jgi:hypothetical protein